MCAPRKPVAPLRKMVGSLERIDSVRSGNEASRESTSALASFE